MLRRALDNWRRGGNPTWVPPLPGGSERLKLTLERLDGREKHDWIRELGAEYESLSVVVRAGAELLLLDGTIRVQADQLINWTRDRIRTRYVT